MHAIHAKYYGPSRSKGSRIVARMGQRRVTIPYPHNVSMGETAHYMAVMALMKKLELPYTEFSVAVYNNSYIFIPICGGTHISMVKP